jgi:hypothetical protein
LRSSIVSHERSILAALARVAVIVMVIVVAMAVVAVVPATATAALAWVAVIVVVIVVAVAVVAIIVVAAAATAAATAAAAAATAVAATAAVAAAITAIDAAVAGIGHDIATSIAVAIVVRGVRARDRSRTNAQAEGIGNIPDLNFGPGSNHAGRQYPKTVGRVETYRKRYPGQLTSRGKGAHQCDDLGIIGEIWGRDECLCNRWASDRRIEIGTFTEHLRYGRKLLALGWR